MLAASYEKFKSLVLFNPLATGPLLYILTRSPPHDSLRTALLKTIVHIDTLSSKLNTSSDTLVATSVKVLKWLFVLGVVSKVNSALNRIALNKWSLRPQGVPYDWRTPKKEIVVITGGCSGFGALMVEMFEERTGAKIVVMDIQDLPKKFADLPLVHYYKCDLSNSEDVSRVTEAIKKEVGNPSVLINNAGIGTSSLIIDAKPEWIEKIFKVNVMSHWQTVAAFLPGMLKAKKGHIVCLASMASFVSPSNITDYCATKAGLLAFHEGLNQELKHRYENGRCIQTTIVHPTFAKTPLVTNGMAKSGSGKGQEKHLLPPEMISDRVVRQVISGKSAQIFVPDNVARAATIKGWPTWLQEMLRDGASKLTK